ncbi:hypothetical protein EV201_0892 [Ancylomarina subtilis]|uniref:FIST-like protein n=1 Tax=Ancylomarina subtilis TaxID=1639035 RepID=A0A4Q7VJ93_9BACT|nr:FIST N-terminal domain-containing protein [Ancylomarina subtilis]RZT96256.1 hypothetical protein EV201_0892 [Ancylomarina subtilis]
MRSIYIHAHDLVNLEHTIRELEQEKQTKAVLFLMADADHYTKDLLAPILNEIKKPFIGGVFPELIFEGERKNSGVLLLPLSFEIKTQLFDLNENSEDFLKQLKDVQVDSLASQSSLFVFVDALSSHKVSFIESLFDFFGMNTSYVGGGAGSLSFESLPCIISNEGIHANAAVIGWADKKMTLGVAHGWKAISDVLKITQTDHNLVQTINWEPAVEVYKTFVEAHSGKKITADNFYEIAKSYPLGIEKLDAEMIVRDPIWLTSEGLQLIDEIREGEYIKILNGDLESLLEGASNAKDLALSNLQNEMDHDALFCIDCISRVLFMNETYGMELGILSENKKVSGILSLGEIANEGDSFLEIYNKTIAIGIW